MNHEDHDIIIWPTLLMFAVVACVGSGYLRPWRGKASHTHQRLAYAQSPAHVHQSRDYVRHRVDSSRPWSRPNVRGLEGRVVARTRVFSTSTDEASDEASSVPHNDARSRLREGVEGQRRAVYFFDESGGWTSDDFTPEPLCDPGLPVDTYFQRNDSAVRSFQTILWTEESDN